MRPCASANSGDLPGIRELNGTHALCYEVAMLKAYVGIASKHGLNVFYSEREDTLEWVRSMAGKRVIPKRISFWAVVPDDEARRIAILLHRGQKNEALRLLDRAATDMGQILPSDGTSSSVH